MVFTGSDEDENDWEVLADPIGAPNSPIDALDALGQPLCKSTPQSPCQAPMHHAGILVVVVHAHLFCFNSMEHADLWRLSACLCSSQLLLWFEKKNTRAPNAPANAPSPFNSYAWTTDVA